jgi:hypothetical protein
MFVETDLHMAEETKARAARDIFWIRLSQILCQFTDSPSKVGISHPQGVIQMIQNCGLWCVQSFSKRVRQIERSFSRQATISRSRKSIIHSIRIVLRHRDLRSSVKRAGVIARRFTNCGEPSRIVLELAYEFASTARVPERGICSLSVPGARHRIEPNSSRGNGSLVDFRWMIELQPATHLRPSCFESGTGWKWLWPLLIDPRMSIWTVGEYHIYLSQSYFRSASNTRSFPHRRIPSYEVLWGDKTIVQGKHWIGNFWTLVQQEMEWMMTMIPGRWFPIFDSIWWFDFQSHLFPCESQPCLLR